MTLLCGAIGCGLAELGRYMGRKLFFSAIGLAVLGGAYPRYGAGAVAGLVLWLGWVWWGERCFSPHGDDTELVVDDGDSDEVTKRD